MIIDTFIFFNEFDILEGRLEYLYDHVDYFVIVESNLTHSGETKPLYLMDHMDRYKKYQDKILYYPYIVYRDQFNFDRLPVNDHDFTAGSWQMENAQRNYISEALKRFDGADIVMVSDVDEIPNKDAIAIAQGHFSDVWPIFVLKQDYFNYNFRQKMSNPWYGTVISTNSFIQHLTPQGARNIKADIAWIDNAGWHLTYWGTPEQIKTKVQSFAHQELNTAEFTDPDYIRQQVESGRDLYNRDVVQTVPVDPATIPTDIYNIFGKLNNRLTAGL